jgi:hypothetical protein
MVNSLVIRSLQVYLIAADFLTSVVIEGRTHKETMKNAPANPPLGRRSHRGAHRRCLHEPTHARGQHVGPSLKEPPRLEAKFTDDVFVVDEESSVAST